MKKLFILLFAASFILGCSDDKTENNGSNAQISINTETMLFSVGGEVVDGTNAVTVTSNSPWRLTGKKTWCTPSVVAGKSGDVVTFTATGNPAYESRTATFSFICGDKVAKLVVTQKQSAVLDIFSETEYEVDSNTNTITVRLTASSDLTYEIAEKDTEWIFDADTRGAEKLFLSFNIAKNDTYAERTGSILFKVDGKEAVISIKQLQNNAIIPKEMVYNIGIEGGSLTIDLQSNIDYTVSIPTKYRSWITQENSATRGLTPSQTTFSIGESTGTRAGQIIFSNSETKISIVVAVMQRSGEPVYCVIPDKNFRDWLASKDYIVVADATTGKCEMMDIGSEVTSLDCSSNSIVSLEGIEAFTKLTTLKCESNKIVELNLSKCLNLTSLNPNRNPLKSMILGDINVTSIQMPYCWDSAPELIISSKLLKTFEFNSNYDTLELDVSECPALSNLNLNYSELQILWLKTGQEIAKISNSGCNYETKYR